MAKPRKLTHKEESFTEHFVDTLNGTKAAKLAKYSPNSARQIASENLSKPVIKKEIDRLKAIREKKVGLTAEKVLNDIERVRQKAEGSEQFNISLKASELQGKHLALFTERVAHEGEIKWPEIHISLDS